MYNTPRASLALVAVLSGLLLLTGCPIFPDERENRDRDHQRSNEQESVPREDDHHQGHDHE